MEARGPRPIRLGPLTRFAPVLALIVLLALAIGFDRTVEAQFALSRILSATARQGFAESGLVPLAQAAVAGGLWLAWLIARILLFFAAFLLVELLLIGPPKSWRVAAFAVAVQVSLGLLYALLKPAVHLMLPDRVRPLVTIEQAQIEPLLGPFAPVLLALAAVLVFDLVGYWLHRAQHAIPILWRFHSVHHSVEDMDSLNSYVHPVDIIGQRIGMLLVGALIGFRFETVIWILAFGTIYDRLRHTRAPINFGPLGRVFVDNRYHFVHHTIHTAQAGRNFAASFTLLDRLFGTYRAPEPDGLGATGLGDKLPPTTLRQFFLASLSDRPRPDGRGPA